MKVTVLPENLIKYIPLINRVLPSHPQVPILSNVLLEASSAGFYIFSTNLDLGVMIKIPAKIEEEGGTTVPGKEFLEAVGNLPKNKIQIESDKDKLKVMCLENNLTFRTIDKGEFPQIFKKKGEKITSLSKKDFIEIFTSIIFSISQEETRPQLTGVFVDPKKDAVNFVSTDGYRMSIKKGWLDKKGGGSMVIPSKLINEAVFLKGEEDVVIYKNKEENQIIFEVGEAVLVGRMIEGAFPDYERVLPQKSETVVVFEREALLQNVRLVSVFAKDTSNVVTLTVSGGQILLETKSQGVGEGEALVECDQKGKDVKISFNIKYLNEVLKASKETDLILKLNSSIEPAIFENRRGDFIHVIMPIQVD